MYYIHDWFFYKVSIILGKGLLNYIPTNTCEFNPNDRFYSFYSDFKLKDVKI